MDQHDNGDEQPKADQPAVLDADVGRGNTATEREEKKHASEHRLRLLEVFFAGAVALFALVQAGVSYWQWDVMDRQLQLSNRQLELSERPWVAADASVQSPMVFDDKGVGRITIGLQIRNTGNSVAVDVYWRSRVYALRKGFEDRVTASHEEYCEPMRHRDGSALPGAVLFPGDKALAQEFTQIDAEEVQSALRSTPVPGMISMLLVVCVDYRFAFASDHHQTRYTYPLGQPNPASPAWMGFFEPKGTLNLQLIGSLAGNFAD